MKFKGYDEQKLKEQLRDRFTVTYRINAGEKDAREMAKNITVEQTVEFPAAHIECEVIQSDIIGRIEEFAPCEGGWRAVISYSDQSGTEEFTQFLNVVFGNTSLLPGITVETISLSREQETWFPGPKFGIEGIRQRLQVFDRPIAFTALKPMGLPTESFVEEAYRCALGGVDMIKDDHGLANQTFSSFRERVQAVCKAVEQAYAETGKRTAYVPNLSGSFDQIMDRVHFAEDCQAGGVMLAPALVGYDTLQYVAGHTTLPVIAHPAMAGCFLDKGSGGFECGCINGLIPRICGADITVFPNYGGRFSLSKEQCRSIVRGCTEGYGSIKPILPAPAGGMTFEKIPAMKEFYGTDVALLMGGGLFTVSADLTENCRRFIGALQ